MSYALLKTKGSLTEGEENRYQQRTVSRVDLNQAKEERSVTH